MAVTESSLYALQSQKTGTIAYRPPLFPSVLALADWLFGRQFWAARFWNAGCLAATCGLIVTFLARRIGPLPALLTAAMFVVLDTRTRLYGRAILTEAMAALCVAVLCWGLIRVCRAFRRKNRVWIGSGLRHGAAHANAVYRLAAGVIAAVDLAGLAHGATLAGGPHYRVWSLWGQRSSSLCLGWSGIVWVLGEMMPLGSQGWSQLSAAFGDSAWEHSGLWTNLEQEGFFDGVLHPNMTTLQREVATPRTTVDRKRCAG